MPADPPCNQANLAPSAATIRVGVISDTHGYLNPGLVSIFKTVDRIIHTGDIEAPESLDVLAQMAPLDAVRGNMDFGKWAARLPREDLITIGAVSVYALHDLTRLTIDPETAGIQVVLSGHTHRPEARWRGTCLYLNPGSATLPRTGLAPSVALLDIRGCDIKHRFVSLPES